MSNQNKEKNSASGCSFTLLPLLFAFFLVTYGIILVFKKVFTTPFWTFFFLFLFVGSYLVARPYFLILKKPWALWPYFLTLWLFSLLILSIANTNTERGPAITLMPMLLGMALTLAGIAIIKRGHKNGINVNILPFPRAINQIVKILPLVNKTEKTLLSFIIIAGGLVLFLFATFFQIGLTAIGIIPTITSTPTITLTPTLTPTITPTPTLTPTRTLTSTITLTPSITPSPTITYTPSKTPTPTNTNTPTATITPTFDPNHLPYLFMMVDHTKLVSTTDYAHAKIITKPGNTCYIVYILPSGRWSSAKGLDSTVANENGFCSWYWNIGFNTNPGIGYIVINVNGYVNSFPIEIK